MLARSRTLPARIHNGIVEERHGAGHYIQVEVQSKAQAETEALNLQANYSKCFHDYGRLKRTVTLWIAIGSGMLPLPWAIAQLGWVAGPTVLLFALVILYTSNLLSQCYGPGDPVTGPGNYTYMDAVKVNLGQQKVKICMIIQYLNLFGVAIGYTLAASGSMEAIVRTNCLHKTEGSANCYRSGHGYIAAFGITEIILSQIPGFAWWLCLLAAVMSLTYSTIGLGLGIAKIAGYAAFGDIAPGDLIASSAFSNPYWLLDIANLAVAIHIVCAYRVYCQPLFALAEKWSAHKWAKSDFVTAEYEIPIPFYGVYQLNFFRMTWRTIFIVLTTFIAMLLPFFEYVVGMLGAIGFWPLTVYFPIEMYISQKKITPWTNQWVGLEILSMACLFVSVAAAVGSVAALVDALKFYVQFEITY